jgi:hypothetical protein
MEFEEELPIFQNTSTVVCPEIFSIKKPEVWTEEALL